MLDALITVNSHCLVSGFSMSEVIFVCSSEMPLAGSVSDWDNCNYRRPLYSFKTSSFENKF